jgi:predicted NBD/HSP70 family sugar kinase
LNGKGSSFEDLISGKSIKRIYGKHPEDISDRKIWNKIMDNLSIGIANTIYYWSPDGIVLGGGVTHSDNFNLVMLRSKVEKIVKKTYPSLPEIKKSALSDFSGIWGGIAYLSSHF